MGVRRQSKHELAAAQQARYLKAKRAEKGRILDEFVAATGYHRKRAVGLLRHGPPPPRAGRGGRPRVYSALVVGALRVVVEASGWLCSKQQVPIHTYTPWEEQRPGFVEIDLVAHCGTSTAGHDLNTLTVTDTTPRFVPMGMPATRTHNSQLHGTLSLASGGPSVRRVSQPNWTARALPIASPPPFTGN